MLPLLLAIQAKTDSGMVLPGADTVALKRAMELKTDTSVTPQQRIFIGKHGDSFTCNTPKTFDFATHIPKDGLGYTIAGLLSLAMINNGTHWAGDNPLGFTLGYGFGKFIAKKNRIRLKHAF